MAIAILAQGNSLELERAAPVTIACDRQSVVTCKTEEDPLFQDLPLHTLITWTRWWHLTAKALVLVLKKRVCSQDSLGNRS